MELSQSLTSLSLVQRATGRTRSDAVVELETAVARFQAHLKDDERKKLQGLKATPHDIQAVIIFTAELDRSDLKRRGKSVATRLSSFLQTIQQFFPAIDTFVSSNPELAALIWGSVRLTFVVTVVLMPRELNMNDADMLFSRYSAISSHTSNLLWSCYMVLVVSIPGSLSISCCLKPLPSYETRYANSTQLLSLVASKLLS